MDLITQAFPVVGTRHTLRATKAILVNTTGCTEGSAAQAVCSAIGHGFLTWAGQYLKSTKTPR